VVAGLGAGVVLAGFGAGVELLEVRGGALTVVRGAAVVAGTDEVDGAAVLLAGTVVLGGGVVEVSVVTGNVVAEPLSGW
jgi:hypothetical protein